MQPPETRNLIGRRHFVIGGAFAAASAVAYARQPIAKPTRMPPGTLESWMPDRIGPWTYVASSGIVLPPQDALSERLYDNLVTRVYTAPDDSQIMLLVAYSNVQDGLLQIHRPEFCYTAGGFALTPTRPVTLRDARGIGRGANAFVASGPAHIEQVLYWTRIGKTFPQSWVQQRMAVVEANLQRQIPDGLLARISMVSSASRVSIAPLEKFAAALDRAAPTPLRSILFGAS